MGRLTTHVLDIQHGIPAKGVHIELYILTDDSRRLLKQLQTNADGRCDEPLLQAEELKPGIYELIFHMGDYFAAKAVNLSEPAFLDQVPIRFGVADPLQNYHVPLVASPWAYSSYRGS